MRPLAAFAQTEKAQQCVEVPPVGRDLDKVRPRGSSQPADGVTALLCPFLEMTADRSAGGVHKQTLTRLCILQLYQADRGQRFLARILDADGNHVVFFPSSLEGQVVPCIKKIAKEKDDDAPP